jgi:HSP90 family molecular chaperone
MEMFSEIAENKDDYAKFYEAFGKNLKLVSVLWISVFWVQCRDCLTLFASPTRTSKLEVLLKQLVAICISLP